MIVWLVIYGSPTRQIYMTSDALPYLSASLSKHGLLLDVGSLNAGTAGENSNITFQLDNKSGQCTTLFAKPPVGSRAVLFGLVSGVATEQFSGVIQSVSLDSESAQVEIEA